MYENIRNQLLASQAVHTMVSTRHISPIKALAPANVSLVDPSVHTIRQTDLIFNPPIDNAIHLPGLLDESKLREAVSLSTKVWPTVAGRWGRRSKPGGGHDSVVRVVRDCPFPLLEI